MKLWSLRQRMLVMSGVATLAALIIAGWAMAGVLSRFVTEGLDQRLEAQLAMMATAVRSDGTVDRALIDRRLGVMRLGPDWRWRISGPAGTIGSTDFPAFDPGPPRPPHPHPNDPIGDDARQAPIPYEGQDSDGRVHSRQAMISTNNGTVTLVAAAPSGVIARPIRAALIPLVSVIAIMAAIFTVAALLQLRLGLQPVLALRDQVGDIRRGTRESVDEDQPAELRPLAIELNALAAESAAALTAARASAANLAHALKTPVATLALTVEDNPEAIAQVERMEAVIRRHLTRARTAAVARRASTLVAPVVADVVQVIAMLRPAIDMRVDVPDGLAVSLDAHDLAEILGNLLDNAARHARATVSVTAGADGDRVSLSIADDGPGIPLAQRERAMQPGIRLDEAPTGDGFGLAIVRDLIALHGGTLDLLEADNGGLLVRLSMALIS